MSDSRTGARSLRATSWSRTSPLRCPSVSFTSLNRSRSISMTQTAAAGAARRSKGLIDAVVEERPVRKAGERVVQRLVLDLAHPLLELRPALGERLLRDVAGRHVDHVALRVERVAGLVPHADGDVVDPHDPAVLRDQPVLPVEHVAGHVGVGELAEDVIAVVGVEHLAEEVRVGHPLLGRVSGELLDLRADVEGALGVEALDVRHQRELLDHALIPGLRLGERVLGHAAVGHVLAHAHDARRGAVGVRSGWSPRPFATGPRRSEGRSGTRTRISCPAPPPRRSPARKDSRSSG